MQHGYKNLQGTEQTEFQPGIKQLNLSKKPSKVKSLQMIDLSLFQTVFGSSHSAVIHLAWSNILIMKTLTI